MARKIGLVLAGVFGVLTCLAAGADDKEKKTPTIKEVMKSTAGKQGLCAKCNAAAKDKKWDDAQKLAKELKECGEALAKNSCPKGDGESWTKLSKQYKEQTEAIAKAAEDKDGKEFAAAITKFTKSCKACHDAHK